MAIMQEVSRAPAPLRSLFARGSLKLGAVATMTVNLAGTALSYAATVLLARLLDPAGFGLYSFVFSLALMLVLPAQLGLPMLVVREVAHAARGGGWGRVRGLIRWSRQFVLVGTLLVALVGGAVFVLIPAVRAGADLLSLLWGLALVPIMGLIGIEGAILRGSFRVALAQVPDRVLRQLLQITLLLGWWWTGRAVTPSVALGAAAAGALGALLLAAVLAGRARHPASRTAAWEQDRRAWLASALPMGLTNGLAVITSAAGPVVLGYVAPPAEAGSFRIASQFALVGGLVYTTLVSVLAPRFAAARGDATTLSRLNQAGTRATTAAAVACLAGFVLLGRWIVARLFGADYLDAWWPTVILLAGACLNAAFGFAASILSMNGGERVVSRCLLASTALMLVASVPAGAWYGATGVAMASVAATLVANVALWRSLYHRAGVNSSISMSL